MYRWRARNFSFLLSSLFFLPSFTLQSSSVLALSGLVHLSQTLCGLIHAQQIIRRHKLRPVQCASRGEPACIDQRKLSCRKETTQQRATFMQPTSELVTFIRMCKLHPSKPQNNASKPTRTEYPNPC
ncbi:hypothetical protein DER46DRAFT_606393 [Fusarium sp. MPI-SDFR-AT-0072]|nr:hypothetical protein DER46DRAFT_606393 [Fusarium sp. MPI-SDFR-AT-0072]